MKKMLLTITILVLASIAVPIHAADLQAGSYVTVHAVHIWQFSGGEPYVRAGGWFNTAPGQYGPFNVTDGPYHARSERDVTVPLQVSGAGPSDSLELPMGFGMTIGEPVAWIDFSWETDYDANQMYLELWRYRYAGNAERIWSQQLSGRHYEYTTHMLYLSEFEGNLFFKVNVLPEPSSLAVLAAGLAASGLAFWRRRR